MHLLRGEMIAGQEVASKIDQALLQILPEH
jgi:hypothetical protein